MISSRILGCCWAILAVIYYIASDSWLALAVLLLTAGLAIYLPVSVLTGRRMLGARFVLEGEIMKGQQAGCRIEVHNRSLLPLAKAQITVLFHNILTGEKEEISTSVSIPGRGRDPIRWDLRSRYAGKIEVRIHKVVVYDLLGIFSAERILDLAKPILVTPETFYTEVDISNRNAPDMDSDHYSDSKKGFDSGETFGIREYMPGDSIKSIHWKLSSKLDKILIRELGFPIQKSILLLLETGWQKEKITPAAADLMVEAFISISQSLANSQMDHHVCWFDHGGSILVDREITDQEGVVEVMRAVLSAPMVRDDSSVIVHYLDEFRDLQAAHVVYITSAVDIAGIRPFLASCCLTVLKCEADDMNAEDSYLPSGISLIPFYERTIKEDLCQLDI